MGKKSYACHNCRRGRGQHCITCKAVEGDDIRIRLSPHNREELQSSERNPWGRPWGNVTRLPADVEDTLRHFLFAVTSLDALQFVAALHLLRRGERRALADTIRALAADVRMYLGKPGEITHRATIWAKWRKIVGRMPELRAAALKWDGHGGRPKRAPKSGPGDKHR